ncbi:hypothetical protein EMCRGX_G015665 [Ephydatia muelleri]
MSVHSDQLTVTWTSVPTATSYNVSINDSVNTLVPTPSTRAPQYTFTGLTNNTVYTVSVVTINCAGSSSALASNSTLGTSTEKRDDMAMGTKTAHEAQISSTVHEVDTNKNMKRDAMEMGTCGTHVSSIVNDEVGSNKDMRRDAMELGTNTAYGTHVSSTEVGSNKDVKTDAVKLGTNAAYGSHV